MSARDRTILVLHGPNLNLLGEREPEIYGSLDLRGLNARLRAVAIRLRLRLRIFQSNAEGELIDLLHRHRRAVAGVVFNPGAYTHYSYALRDAVAAIAPPTVEVHLSDIRRRESFRRVSVIAPVCARQISGRGWESYADALAFLAESTPEAARRPRSRKPAKSRIPRGSHGR